MYNLNLSKPKFSRGVQLRDDAVMPPMDDPMAAPLDEPEVTAETPTVQAVTAVQPQMKKFRATICRTVTQSAIVEFEALETQAQYSMSEDLAEQVPAEAWTTDPANSWCYIDKLEDLGAASAALDPTAPDQILEDDTLSPGDGATDDPNDELLPPAAASRRRRAPSRRMEPDELIAQAQAILDEADTARNSLGMPDTVPADVVAILQECQGQIQDLQYNASGDMSGVDADIDAQTAASQFVAEVASQIDEMLQEAQADADAAASQAAAA